MGLAKGGIESEAVMDEWLERLVRLARLRGVGLRTVWGWIEAVGVEALFEGSWGELRSAGVSVAAVRRLRGGGVAEAREEWEALRGLGAELWGWGTAAYPVGLRSLCDPPLTVSVLGRTDWGRCVGVVGARRASRVAQDFTRQLAGELAAAGWCVVSGLARGVDAAAHLGALDAGGTTVAVLPGGLGRVYPAGHAALAERIVESGALVSEVAPFATPRRWSFPQRNRVLAGLVEGVVVVQAGARSGALITAELALEAGREVMAVPGWVWDPLAQGTNRLIKDGATLVESGGDALDSLAALAQE